MSGLCGYIATSAAAQAHLERMEKRQKATGQKRTPHMIFTHNNLLKAKDYKPGVVVHYAQVKADGLRLMVDTGNRVALTREGKTDFWDAITGIQHMVECLRRVPTGTVLDGELHVPGVQATDIKTLAIERDPRLRFTPFAMPIYAGQDYRQVSLEKIAGMLLEFGFPTSYTVGLDLAFNPQSLLDRCRDMKIEGWVLKAGHYNGWYKLKPVRTVDCVVTGITISDSLSFLGGLKAIQVSLFDDEGKSVEVASVGAGFEADYRMMVDPKSLIGRVAEVAYDSLAGKGKLKFPRFVRWRDDKPASECTVTGQLI